MRESNKLENSRKQEYRNDFKVQFQRKEDFILNMKEKCKMELVGGKAFNISQMVREKIPVPEGFCITVKAYDYFMDFNNITGVREEIGDEIRKGVIPPDLAEVIVDAHRTHLSGNLCAVRSSSPLEDLKSASFAGQYKSFLNVSGENELLNAVKECWASLWSQRAVEYRKKMGIKKDVTMAVLIQEMVPAEASGVLFTGDQMIIEGVWGLGDMLVGGKAVPDRYVVKGSAVTKRDPVHKEVMSKVTHTGVEVVQVPEQLRDTPVLTDALLRKLCALGKKVEELFGCPQDIEWALLHDEFILLQARPITVKQEVTVWSRANAAETIPGYCTYLSRLPENKPDEIVLALTPLLECFGIKEDPKNLKFRDYIYGYVYLNMTIVGNVLGQIPGLSPEILYQSLGHTTEEENPEIRLGLSTAIKLVPGTLRVIRFFLQLPKRAEKVIPHSVELIEDIRHKNLQELSVQELDNLVWEMYERNSQVFQVHAVTALASFALFGVLQKITARIGEEGTENLLTIGLEGMSSSRLGVEMWKLAQHALKSPKVAELILSGKDVLEELKSFPEGGTFLEELEKFADVYGDRCSQELELSVPRWEEDPSFVLSMVRTYLHSEAEPVKTMEEQKKIRLEATDRILKKLSWNPLNPVFRKLLKKTQQYMVTRENLKTTWMRGISALRVLYLAIAKKFVEEGILKARDDIFFLKQTEVSDIIAGTLRKDQLKDRIAERKKEKKECEHIEVPEIIVGGPPPLSELQCVIEPQDILEGVGCSPGVVTGRAKVISDPRECSEFEEGDVLVAPITDPGWSPLFVTAGGLVMELGGTLSHGVIIAREYGIPAVVGVKNATKIIKTGQEITIDGNKGVVYIM